METDDPLLAVLDQPARFVGGVQQESDPVLHGSQIKLPDEIWARLNAAWIVFFATMGFLNLYVAFEFPEATWVKFKLFGGMGLMFAFVIAQSMFLGKYIEEDKQ